MANIWNFIENKLNEEKSIYLMVNIESNGSSPGKQGFGMAVCSDGSLHGSIGGGIMEFRLVEQCREMLKNGQHRIFIKKQVHKGNVADGSGMICSGDQTVAFVPFHPSDVQYVERITSCLNENNTGILELTGDGFEFALSGDIHHTQYQSTITDENTWAYRETIGHRNTVYIIGAGHVGFAVSKLFRQLNFIVVLIDNRTDLSMMTDNPHADKKLVIDYKETDKYIAESNNSYVIIMTDNHAHDKEVLGLVIKKKVKYLGLMGSKGKIAELMGLMKAEGFTDSEMNHLHAPIGVPINSHTPDEIAISIAAEIIGVKNAG